jgi:nucleoside 2-deoxyribosyltransferase
MLKLYIAGKVSKNSSFGTHYWRDDFCNKLAELSGRELENLDPTKNGAQDQSPEIIFGADSAMIKQCDVLIVYLSDDISVGGSQEIMIAKYYQKPVIGFAPIGGKFNGSKKVLFGQVIENYKDPFVFATCDAVCGSIEEVGEAIKNISNIKVKSIDIIEKYRKEYLKKRK